jgi:hypothetical protein
MRVPPMSRLKTGRRLLSLASIVVGLSLMIWEIHLDRSYGSTMPRESDKATGRTVATTVRDGTRVFVTEAEARAFEQAQTSLTFGWPFLVLGILLGVTAGGTRDAVEPGADANVLWTDRK